MYVFFVPYYKEAHVESHFEIRVVFVNFCFLRFQINTKPFLSIFSSQSRIYFNREIKNIDLNWDLKK